MTPWAVAHQAPLSMGILQARILEKVAMPSSRRSSNPGIKPRSAALQADSLPSEPPGKPKNTGVGSHSLLQGMFLTQELNQSLLHCRQILCQLSSQGSPVNAGDTRDVGLIPVLGRSPGEGLDNLLQYSCLENPMDTSKYYYAEIMTALYYAKMNFKFLLHF